MTPRAGSKAAKRKPSEVETRGRCSHCGETMALKDGLLPYHDFPKPCRQLCRGAKMPPVDALIPAARKP